jgi:hypothetical protein
MNRIVDQIIEEMELCNPKFWASLNPTKKAKSVAVQFSRNFEYEILSERIIRAAEKKAKIESEKRKLKKSRDYHQKWNDIIMKAHNFYGDMLYEYSVSINGENGGEMLSSGAWFPSSDIEEECMRDALYAARPVCYLDDPKFYDDAIRYWKKYCN